MKVILSDFDGTLFFGKEKDYSKIKAAIENWQSKGNLFCMVTGRSLTHLTSDLEPMGLKPDYYILSTGATIYNKDYELVNLVGITKEDVKTIVETAKNLDYMFVGASAVDGICLKQPNTEDFSYDKEFISGFARFNTQEAAALFNEEISKKLSTKLLIVKQDVYFDMPHITCGKANGIKRFMKLLNLTENQVFCAGDGVNDLDMLKSFESFSFNHAHIDAKNAATHIVESLEDVINYLSE